MNVRTAIVRKAREVLEALAAGRVEPWMAATAREVLPSLSERRGIQKAPIASVAHVADRRAEEDEDARAARRETRAAVAARAAGCCEACGARRGEALHWDHFWGRGREESVEGSWMLCPRCDREKTENVPTRIAWLERFGAHAELHGYREQGAKVDSAVALERAQHPEAIG